MKILTNWFTSVFPVKLRNREQLINALRTAEHDHILDGDAEIMLEGVLQVSEMQVRDIMIPAHSMVAIRTDTSFDDILKIVIEHSHSRYPILNTDEDAVTGILLAKNLLRYTLTEQRERFNLNKIIQPTLFVPETQHLDKLLKQFKTRHIHMAIVVDEYGHLSGLVTMEDVLEQIVGNIEDETDYVDDTQSIKKYDDHYVIKANTSLAEFNEYFSTQLNHTHAETIGGLVLSHLGHIPNRDESCRIDQFEFTVLQADKRSIRLLRVNQQSS